MNKFEEKNKADDGYIIPKQERPRSAGFQLRNKDYPDWEDLLKNFKDMVILDMARTSHLTGINIR